MGVVTVERMSFLKKKKKIKTIESWNGHVFELVRSSRRSLALEVNDRAVLTVRAPFRIGSEEIYNFIGRYSTWIQKKVSLSEKKLQEVKHSTFSHGDTISYLGCQYPLEINNSSFPFFTFNNGTFILDSKKVMKGSLYLEKWYRDRAKEICTQVVKELALLMNVEFNNIRINGSKHRWGSCSTKGNLNFSWKLVMAPHNVLRYVVVHELSHLLHMNHSKRFWNNVEKYMPEYHQYKKWLKDNGHTLVI